MPILFRFTLTATLLGVSAALLPAALQVKEEASRSDVDLLQGTWVYGWAEIDGEVVRQSNHVSASEALDR
jgi:hypothetical protein